MYTIYKIYSNHLNNWMWIFILQNSWNFFSNCFHSCIWYLKDQSFWQSKRLLLEWKFSFQPKIPHQSSNQKMHQFHPFQFQRGFDFQLLIDLFLIHSWFLPVTIVWILVLVLNLELIGFIDLNPFYQHP